MNAIKLEIIFRLIFSRHWHKTHHHAYTKKQGLVHFCFILRKK